MAVQKYTNNMFVCVVVCTFNRSDRLHPCLDSLEHQTYPRDLFEIIVVDDASTDDTVRIARSRNVKVIERSANGGAAAARNSGIAAAKGSIISFIDDDAVADPQWLERLIEPLKSSEISAVGGLILAYKTDYLAERYLSAIGSGNPAPLSFGKSKNPLWRFWAYLGSMFKPLFMEKKLMEVQAIFTANAAFQAAALRTVGGFDEKLRYDEDADMSTRLRDRGARFLFVPDAIVYHRHRESLSKLIRQTYRNAENTLRYYAKENKALPVFPLPIFYLVLVVCIIILNPLIGTLFIIFGPLGLYPWWIVRALRERTPEYLIYGYIQLILELTSIFGLIRGKIRQLRS
jgi:GT2 family glycosyltransferase